MEIINSAILEKAYKVQYYVEAAVLHKWTVSVQYLFEPFAIGTDLFRRVFTADMSEHRQQYLAC